MRNKVLFAFLPIFTLVTSCGGNAITYDIQKYFLSTTYESDYRILVLSDLHLSNKDYLERHLKLISLSIEEADPHFMVFNGDLFTYGDSRTREDLFTYINHFGIPWTVTLGNYDYQAFFSTSDLINDLKENYGNCLFLDNKNDDVYGTGNFVINVTQFSTIKFQMIFLDSNAYTYKEYHGYDYIHEDQIEWYKKVVNYSTNLNHTIIPNLVFHHIPLPEYETAYLKSQDGSGEATLLKGSKGQEVGCPKINTGLFDQEVALKATVADIASHDHNNNYDVLYKGVRLIYGAHSTDRGYGDDSKIGSLLLTIGDEGKSVTSQYIYHNYKEIN